MRCASILLACCLLGILFKHMLPWLLCVGCACSVWGVQHWEAPSILPSFIVPLNQTARGSRRHCDEYCHPGLQGRCSSEQWCHNMKTVNGNHYITFKNCSIAVSLCFSIARSFLAVIQYLKMGRTWQGKLSLFSFVL